MRCWYCGREAKLIPGDELYGDKNPEGKLYWKCEPCNAWVGCHKGTDRPLGELAKFPLRKARAKTHRTMDWLRRETGMSRSEAYRWLSEALNLDKRDCHIGMFDRDLCYRAVEVMREEVERRCRCGDTGVSVVADSECVS